LNTLIAVILFPQMLISLISLKHGYTDLALFFSVCYTHATGLLLVKECDTTLLVACFIVTMPSFTYILRPSTKVYAVSVLMCIMQSIYCLDLVKQKYHSFFIEEQSWEITGPIVFISFISILFYCFQIIENSFCQALLKYHENVKKMSDEFEKTNLSQDAFISAISHETRNPLNFIHCSIDCLIEHVKDSHFLPVLQDAKRNSILLLNLINNALDAAKLTSDKMEIFSLELSPTDTIFKALKLYSLDFKTKQINLKLLIDQSLPSTINSDESRILQVFDNLLSNALKATPKQGNLTIYATWMNKNSTKEDLLSPIKNFSKKKSVYTFEEENLEAQEEFISTATPTNSDKLYSPCIFDEFDRQETQSNLKKLKYLQTTRIKSLRKDNSTREVSLNAKSYIEYQNLSYQAPPTSPSFILNSPNTETATNGYLKVQITDDGCGIKPEFMSRAFQKFNKTRQADNGVGLGLWICKQICERMGGAIELYSEMNQGTTVVFYIRVNSGLLKKSVLE